MSGKRVREREKQNFLIEFSQETPKFRFTFHHIQFHLNCALFLSREYSGFVFEWQAARFE
jgi:hypothetical protein